mmetsp:Transcript_19486/g.32140  ORF Transcript_19486/g.32140 Transcript_19486/m.32140 type:complete len:109 (-) Transcript_19486:439-765(-)
MGQVQLAVTHHENFIGTTKAATMTIGRKDEAPVFTEKLSREAFMAFRTKVRASIEGWEKFGEGNECNKEVERDDAKRVEKVLQELCMLLPEEKKKLDEFLNGKEGKKN